MSSRELLSPWHAHLLLLPMGVTIHRPGPPNPLPAIAVLQGQAEAAEKTSKKLFFVASALAIVDILLQLFDVTLPL